MSVLYCTRPGKIQYRNSRRVAESNGENRLLAGRFGCIICILARVLFFFFFWKLKATGDFDQIVCRNLCNTNK